MKSIKYFFLIIIVLIINNYGNCKAQSIELPEFVITGVQKIRIRKAYKAKPRVLDFVLQAEKSSDEKFPNILMSKVSIPPEARANLNSKLNAYNGRLILGVGTQTIPLGILDFNYSYEHGSIFSKLFGNKIRNYQSYSGYDESGAELRTDFFIDSKSSFLPGLIVSLEGNYFRNAFNFFGSKTQDLRREIHNGNLEIGLSNYSQSSVKYGLGIKNKILFVKGIDLNENLMSLSAFTKFKVQNFGIEFNAEYSNQDLRNNLSLKNNYNFIKSNAMATFTVDKGIDLKAGVHFSKLDTNSFFSPFASIDWKISERLSFFGEFSPHANLQTYSDFILQNPYLLTNKIDNALVENNSFFKAAIQYSFEKYVEISLGADYANIDDYNMFQDIIESGKFSLIQMKDVDKKSAFINASFYPGPYGSLFMELVFQSVKSDGKFINYEPQIKSNIVYSYAYPGGIDVKIKVDYFSKSYVDFLNNNSIPAFVDISIFGNYDLTNSFAVTLGLENMLNKKNQNFIGYNKKPFEIIAGIDYRW